MITNMISVKIEKIEIEREDEGISERKVDPSGWFGDRVLGRMERCPGKTA